MANYYQNDLFIRGPEIELKRFQSDALPKDHERGDDSWGGHGEGPLSFLSLLPPPDELRSPGVDYRAVEKWRKRHWGCLSPQADDWTFSYECLNYFILSKHSWAHNFVVEASKAYPELAFTLLWSDFNTGVYVKTTKFAMLTVQAGVISMDCVKMRWDTVLALQDELPPLNKLNEDARRFVEFRHDSWARTRKAIAKAVKRHFRIQTSALSDEKPNGNTEEEHEPARMF